MRRRIVLGGLMALGLVAMALLPGVFGSSYAAFSDTEHITGSARAGYWIGSLTIKKVVVPGADTTTFDFTNDMSGCAESVTATEHLGNNQTFTCTFDARGSTPFTVTESAKAGWDLTNIACTSPAHGSSIAINGGANDGDFDSGDNQVVVNVEPQDNIICTFTNSRLPQVKVTKQLSPAADPGVFNLVIDGTTFDDNAHSHDGFGNGENTGFISVPASGTHTVGESQHTGTTLSDYTAAISCDNGHSDNTGLTSLNIGTLAYGDQVSCTITNTRNTGTVVIKKDVAGGVNAQSFAFTSDLGGTCSPDSSQAAFNLADDGVAGHDTETCTGVPTGTYTVTEASATGWTLTSITCDESGGSNIDNSTTNASTGQASIHLEKGETVTCTYLNTRDTGTVTIRKDVAGGTNAQSFDFTSNLTGTCTSDATPAAFSLADDGVSGHDTETCTGVPTGDYLVTESAVTGWTVTGVLTCDESGGSNIDNSTINTTTRAATIHLEKGETVICTFENTQQGGTITITKVANEVTPANAGTDFPFTSDLGGSCTIDASPDAFNLDDDATSATPSNAEVCTNVPAGTYHVTEGVVAVDGNNWALTSLSCTDPTNDTTTDLATRVATIKLTGTESISCTYTNSEIPSTCPEADFNANVSSIIVLTNGDDDFLNDAQDANQSQVIFALGGNDRIGVGASHNNAKDCIIGGDGNDVLFGQNGKDAINGGPGDDLIIGGLAPDAEDGGSGFDACDDYGSGATNCETLPGNLDVSISNAAPNVGGTEDLTATSGYRSTVEYTLKNNDGGTIAVTFDVAVSGTAGTKALQTASVSGTGAGLACTIVSGHWHCTGSLAAGKTMIVGLAVTGTGTSGQTVIYTPTTSCASPFVCTDDTISLANEDGSDLNPVHTDTLTP